MSTAAVAAPSPLRLPQIPQFGTKVSQLDQREDSGRTVTLQRDKTPIQEQGEPPASAALQSAFPSEETRSSFRARSIGAVADSSGDVQAFLDELDVKRRQLDEQIHRYVKQKDREFKVFERDLRIRYRSQRPGQDSTGHDRIGKDGSALSADQCHEGLADAENPDDGYAKANSLEQPTVKTSKTRKRESELAGLFTPSYVALLNSKNGPIDRSPSAPPALPNTETIAPILGREALTRASSDTVVETNLSSPSAQARLRLEKRTSSSGSEASRNLVSVLRTPSGQGKFPKRKRVSLVVGDEIVAPRDDISSGASNLTSELGVTEEDVESASANEPSVATLSTAETSKTFPEVPEAAPLIGKQRSGIASGLAMSQASLPASTFEEPPAKDYTTVSDSDSPFTMDEESKDNPDRQSPQMASFDNAFDRVQTPSPLVSPRSALSMPRSPFASIRTPTKLPTVKTSPTAVQKPALAGFRRPSVREDPHYSVETEAEEVSANEEDQTYGTSPSVNDFLETAGSLGESFMQRNAEENMRRRMSGGSIDRERS